MELHVTNPYDQTLVAELAYDTPEHLTRRLAAASTAFGRWRAVPLLERIATVREGLSRFLAQADVTARDVTRQMGKPREQSRGEIDTLRGRAEYMLEVAPEALAPDRLPKTGFERRIEHVPLGVVLDLAAWNYPLVIAINVIVPALVAGNVVLLKHSAKTPLCGLAFERAFGDLSVPNLVSNLVLTHDMVAGLVAEPAVDHVVFTGSVDGGRQIYGHAAKRLIDVGLELGGKDAAYVAADADLETAVAGIVDGACYNAGQSCCAVERVYVHQSRYREFLDRADALLGEYRLGNPMDDDTTMGPLASRSALDVLDGQVAQAVARGAKLIVGGRRLADTAGNFYLPTLLADVPNDTSAMQQESFGPLLPVASVSSDDEAVARMDDSTLGLTASVWTRDDACAERFGLELDVGTVYQNRCDVLDPALPWTGARDSGLGSTLSRYGYHGLTRRKAIHFRRSS